MKKIVPVEKMTKKQKKQYYSQRRGFNGFNTGTRDMGKMKNEKFADILQKEIDNYNE